jgi:hypothetical protein
LTEKEDAACFYAGIIRYDAATAMPRQARNAPGGYAYHVLNRAVAGLPLLQKPGDYEAFEQVLAEALLGHSAPLRSRGGSGIRSASWPGA